MGETSPLSDPKYCPEAHLQPAAKSNAMHRSSVKLSEALLYPVYQKFKADYDYLTSKMSFTPRSASTTGTTTPSDPASDPPSQSSSSYLAYPVSHVVSGLYRRLTEPSPSSPSGPRLRTQNSHQEKSPDMPHGVYTPPHRTASPFQPPPLTPLTLSGTTSTTVLSRAVAEEIRLLVPPRLQLQDTWSLAYSLEADGVSLATLYSKCASPHIPRNSSFVLVVQDASGGVSLTPNPTLSPPNNKLTLPPDLRRIPDIPPPPLPPLLRHRRMLPLARLHPPALLPPLLPPPSPISPGHRINGPKHHNLCPASLPPPRQLLHPQPQRPRPERSVGRDYARSDPFQGFSIQWRERLFDFLRAGIPECRGRGWPLRALAGWGAGAGGEQWVYDVWERGTQRRRGEVRGGGGGGVVGGGLIGGLPGGSLEQNM